MKAILCRKCPLGAFKLKFAGTNVQKYFIIHRGESRWGYSPARAGLIWDAKMKAAPLPLSRLPKRNFGNSKAAKRLKARMGKGSAILLPAANGKAGIVD